MKMKILSDYYACSVYRVLEPTRTPGFTFLCLPFLQGQIILEGRMRREILELNRKEQGATKREKAPSIARLKPAARKIRGNWMVLFWEDALPA